jgi:hypothetical protein
MNKALFFFSGLSILMITSCTNKADNQSDESLANKNETVIYEVSIELNPETPNWMGNIDKKKLVTKLFSQVENGELDAYGFIDDPQGKTISWDDVLFSMDAKNDTLSILNAETGVYEQKVVKGSLHLNEIKGLIFIEEWSFGTKDEIKKEVLGIAPVRYFYGASDTLKETPKKRIPFVAYYGNKKPALLENY